MLQHSQGTFTDNFADHLELLLLLLQQHSTITDVELFTWFSLLLLLSGLRSQLDAIILLGGGLLDDDFLLLLSSH